MTKVHQQTGGQAITITTSSSESIFELPAQCINLSKSSISYMTVTPDPGATVKVNWLFRDVIAHIRQIQLYTRGGTFLCDINNVDKYSSVALKVDQLARDTPTTDLADPDTRADTFGCRASSAQSNYTPAGENIPGQDTAQFLQIGQDSTATVSNMNVPLSLFKGTIFELDKDLFFNEVVLLKVTWNDYLSHGFFSESLTAPQTNAAAIAANIAVTKLTLYVAVETNPIICAGIIGRVQSGTFVMNIPYVHGYKTNAGSTSAQNVSIRLNRAHGKFLKKIYHILYHATESVATRYNHSNIAGAICSQYYTAVNNRRRQEFNVLVADNDDWVLNREYFKGTLLSDANNYRTSWFIMDKFDDMLCKASDGCVDSGLALDIETKYDLTMTTSAAAHNHYTFAVVSRAMAITPQGIFLA